MSESRRRIVFACLMAAVFAAGWWTGTRLVIEVAPSPVPRDGPELEVPAEVVLKEEVGVFSGKIAAKSSHKVHWFSFSSSIIVTRVGLSECHVFAMNGAEFPQWVGAFVVVDDESSPIRWIRVIAN